MSTPIIVMGVSGCGKSSLGRLLAARLGGAFVEGDDYHPPQNVAKMSAGLPLEDDDRWSWLDSVADAIQSRREHGGVVAACSALKRSYRDRLRLRGSMWFVCLNPQRSVLERRLQQRSGHYMPPSLLDSQLRTLELPQADEGALVLTVDAAPEVLAAAVLEKLGSADARR